MNSDKSTVKPLLNKEIEGILFKIIIDFKKQVLYLDIKSENSIKSTLYSYDFNLEKENTYNNFHSSDSAIFLEDVVNGSAIYSKYKNPRIPQKLGIVCFNIDENTFWENDFLTFETCFEEGISCSNRKFEPTSMVLLDYKNGESLNSNLSEPFNLTDIVQQELQYPEFNESEYSLLKEEMEIRSFLFNKHQIIEIKANNKLLYMDEDHAEKLEMNSSPFFVYKNFLIYLKSGRVIVCNLVSLLNHSRT